MFKLLCRFVPLLVLLVVGGALLASDDWRTQDYKDWSLKDVTKLLNDSPWSRPVPILKDWTTGPPGSPGATSPNDFPMVTILVRWYSSRTIRQAAARGSVLRSHADPAEAYKDVDSSSKTYDLALMGQDLTPFNVLSSEAAIEQLRQATFLEITGTALRVQPLHAEVTRSTDGKKIESVLFYFSKTSADGSPLFAPGTKGVDFICTEGKTQIKTHFDFTKMTTQQGLDL